MAGFDTVNNPQHYASGKIEAIDAIESAMSKEQVRGYLRGNVLKYLWRYDKKNGAEDLKKALWYLERLLNSVEKQ